MRAINCYVDKLSTDSTFKTCETQWNWFGKWCSVLLFDMYDNVYRNIIETFTFKQTIADNNYII